MTIELITTPTPEPPHPSQTLFPAGVTVTCVAYKDGTHGGLSCDWEHIKP